MVLMRDVLWFKRKSFHEAWASTTRCVHVPAKSEDKRQGSRRSFARGAPRSKDELEVWFHDFEMLSIVDYQGHGRQIAQSFVLNSQTYIYSLVCSLL